MVFPQFAMAILLPATLDKDSANLEPQRTFSASFFFLELYFKCVGMKVSDLLESELQT